MRLARGVPKVRARVVGMLVAGALVGCTADRSVRARCERRAADDPAVRALIVQGLGSPFVQENTQGALREARDASVQDCLRREGVLPAGRGGVVLPKGSGDVLFDW